MLSILLHALKFTSLFAIPHQAAAAKPDSDALTAIDLSNSTRTLHALKYAQAAQTKFAGITHEPHIWEKATTVQLGDDEPWEVDEQQEDDAEICQLQQIQNDFATSPALRNVAHSASDAQFRLLIEKTYTDTIQINSKSVQQLPMHTLESDKQQPTPKSVMEHEWANSPESLVAYIREGRVSLENGGNGKVPDEILESALAHVLAERYIKNRELKIVITERMNLDVQINLKKDHPIKETHASNSIILTYLRALLRDSLFEIHKNEVNEFLFPNLEMQNGKKSRPRLIDKRINHSHVLEEFSPLVASILKQNMIDLDYPFAITNDSPLKYIYNLNLSAVLNYVPNTRTFVYELRWFFEPVIEAFINAVAIDLLRASFPAHKKFLSFDQIQDTYVAFLILIPLHLLGIYEPQKIHLSYANYLTATKQLAVLPVAYFYVREKLISTLTPAKKNEKVKNLASNFAMVINYLVPAYFCFRRDMITSSNIPAKLLHLFRDALYINFYIKTLPHFLNGNKNEITDINTHQQTATDLRAKQTNTKTSNKKSWKDRNKRIHTAAGNAGVDEPAAQQPPVTAQVSEASTQQEPQKQPAKNVTAVKAIQEDQSEKQRNSRIAMNKSNFKAYLSTIHKINKATSNFHDNIDMTDDLWYNFDINDMSKNTLEELKRLKLKFINMFSGANNETLRNEFEKLILEFAKDVFVTPIIGKDIDDEKILKFIKSIKIDWSKLLSESKSRENLAQFRQLINTISEKIRVETEKCGLALEEAISSNAKVKHANESLSHLSKLVETLNLFEEKYDEFLREVELAEAEDKRKAAMLDEAELERIIAQRKFDDEFGATDAAQLHPGYGEITYKAPSSTRWPVPSTLLQPASFSNSSSKNSVAVNPIDVKAIIAHYVNQYENRRTVFQPYESKVITTNKEEIKPMELIENAYISILLLQLHHTFVKTNLIDKPKTVGNALWRALTQYRHTIAHDCLSQTNPAHMNKIFTLLKKNCFSGNSAVSY